MRSKYEESPTLTPEEIEANNPSIDTQQEAHIEWLHRNGEIFGLEDQSLQIFCWLFAALVLFFLVLSLL